MEWRDDGIVLGVRRQGETGAILELMTRDHGRHFGLVHGGRSRRLQPVLQAGNGVLATWRARLDEQLGVYAVEAAAARASRLMASSAALHGLSALCSLVRLLPERDPHPAIHDGLAAILDRLDEPARAARLIVRFELDLLGELGFGLDLDACAITGERGDLAYVSPKTGRAVDRAAGEPWRDRLLPLPSFLRDGGEGEPSAAEVAAGFALTGYFLDRHLFEPRGLKAPEARDRFVGSLDPSPAGDGRARGA